MEILNKLEFEMIKIYQKEKDENIPLYFFNKFREDLIDITYSKINSKFSSIPYEKGDFVHLIWKGVKLTLENYKTNQDFKSVLLKNCYFTTIKELRKFMNNGEMVMNVSKSLDKYIANSFKESNSNITYISTPRNVLIENLINDACLYVEHYSEPTIRRVIYLKSLGYKNTEICKKLRLSRHHIDTLLEIIQRMIKKYYL